MLLELRKAQLRTIGQNDAAAEAWLAHLRKMHRFFIVRYSPLEERIGHFAGVDAVIRFGKFGKDFIASGEKNGEVVSFCNGLLDRAGPCNYQFYIEATKGFPRRLYGSGNPEAVFSGSPLSHQAQLEALSSAGVYFCLHTLPASYTLNLIEAMAAGAPVVTLGRQAIALSPLPDDRIRIPEAYEVPDILAGSPIQLTVDTPSAAKEIIGALLEDDRALNKTVGAWCKERFEKLFRAETIAEQWRSFLDRAVCGSGE